MGLETGNHIGDLVITNPDGSVDQKQQGDDHIRLIKKVVKATVEVDHEIDDNANAGNHLQVTMPERASDPTNVANKGFLYTKDVSGITELFYQDDAGTIKQLTDDGKLKLDTFTTIDTTSIHIGDGYNYRVLDNMYVQAAVAASALTISFKDRDDADMSASSKGTIGFNSLSALVPQDTILQLAAALSITAPAGATLGALADETLLIHVYAINSSGTIKIGIKTGQALLDEASSHTTVAIGVGSDTQGVLYSDAVYSNVPVRYVGSILIKNGSTAGNWDNAATQRYHAHSKGSQKVLINYRDVVPPHMRQFGAGNQGAKLYTASDTIAEGIFQYTTFELPAAYTLTLSGSLIILATEAITIAGTLEGDNKGTPAVTPNPLTGAPVNVTNGFFGGCGGSGGSNGSSVDGGEGGDVFGTPGPGYTTTAAAGSNGSAMSAANQLLAQQVNFLNLLLSPESTVSVLQLFRGGGPGGYCGSSSALTTDIGGNGGPLIALIAPRINFTGTINQRGGAGTTVAGFRPGCGGGGGGALLAAAKQYVAWSGTINQGGGLGSTGYLSRDGGDGAAGWTKQFYLSEQIYG